MPTTGRNIVRDALRELGVVMPHETPEATLLQAGLDAANDLLDTWAAKRLTIGGTTISSYSLVSGTASYTIGDGATFDQPYPTVILAWSVIPDDDAADPLEIPMGRPLNAEEWQQIAVKSTTGAYPTRLYFDDLYAAGFGLVYVYPVPDNNDVDIKLYAKVPAVTSLAVNTSYDFTRGYMRALKLTLAEELASRFGKEPSASLQRRASDARAVLAIRNIKPKQSPIQADFLIGRRVGRVDLYHTGE